MNRLLQLGFSEKEAQVYLMLLRIGPSPASAIARRTGLKRATVYSVLETLANRALVTTEETQRGRKYSPHDPECLLYGLEKEKSELQFKLNLARNCIDELQDMRKVVPLEQQKTLFYFGSKAILSSLHSQLSPHHELTVLFSNFGTKSVAAECLRNFLEGFKPMLAEHVLTVPSVQLEQAQHRFSKFSCRGYDFPANISVDADLILQKEHVFFLTSEAGQPQMMQVHDPLYAAFFKQVLLAPYLGRAFF